MIKVAFGGKSLIFSFKLKVDSFLKVRELAFFVFGGRNVFENCMSTGELILLFENTSSILQVGSLMKKKKFLRDLEGTWRTILLECIGVWERNSRTPKLEVSASVEGRNWLSRREKASFAYRDILEQIQGLWEPVEKVWDCPEC